MNRYKELNVNKEVLGFYDGIDALEEYIERAELIPLGFCIVKKSTLYNKLQLIYNTLPKELIENKDYLYKHKKDNVFVQFDNINSLIEQSNSFCGFIIINQNTILDSLYHLLAFLPDDLNFSKTSKLDRNQPCEEL